MLSNHTGSSRGDLGFIPNHPLRPPNRLFFGSPGHPSKKGVAVSSLPSKAETETKNVHIPFGEALITRRTEYLESQERKLTATLSEQRSQQQELKKQLEENAQATQSMTQNQQKDLRAQQQQIFEEMQFVYGKGSRALNGIQCTDKVFQTLVAYAKKKSKGEEVEVCKLFPPKVWIHLMYPMEKVETSTGYQLLMRAKHVDKHTGQIQMCWVIVFELINGVQHRYIKEFAGTPL